MPSKLRFHKDVVKTLEQLASRSPKDYRIITCKLKKFAEKDRGNVKQILPALYRLRGGDWRVYFGWRGDETLVTDLILRTQAYRYDVVERAMRRLMMMAGSKFPKN